MIAFSVPANANLAVSFYLPKATGVATGHNFPFQTNAVATGNVGQQATMPGATALNGSYFLSGLDVQNAAASGAIVTLGASITDGVASASGTNHRWPDFLAQRLMSANKTYGVLNEGIAGNRLLQANIGDDAQVRFSRDVLAQSGVKWVIFADCPVNDLGHSSKALGPQLIAGLQNIILRAHKAKVKVACATLTPAGGWNDWSSLAETGRQAYNNFVKGGKSGCDAVVDFAAATSDPSNPLQYLPANDSGDHLHPTDAGRQAMANCIDLSIFQ